MSIPSFLLPHASLTAGFDPGPEQSGFCVWDSAARRVVDFGIKPNAELMQMIKDGYFSRCGLAGVEAITSYGAVGKAILETCEFSGRLLERLESMMTTHRVYRPDILRWLCGHRQAKKPQARQRLIDLYGPVGTVKAKGPLYGVVSHTWSALAVCVYVLAVFEGREKE